jgi:hypothetical protein
MYFLFLTNVINRKIDCVISPNIDCTKLTKIWELKI